MTRGNQKTNRLVVQLLASGREGFDGREGLRSERGLRLWARDHPDQAVDWSMVNMWVRTDDSSRCGDRTEEDVCKLAEKLTPIRDTEFTCVTRSATTNARRIS